MLSRIGYNNSYSIFNIPQDALYAVNKNTAKAASQILYNNAYRNSFSSAINSAMNNAVSGFASAFGSSLKGLQQSASALSNKNSAVFNTPKAVSNSDKFAVSVQNGANFAAHTVQITNLATAQKNSSVALSAKAAVTLSTTNNTFSLTKDGKKYAFEVDTSKAANNGDLLKNVAEAINKKGVGVSASVTTDETGNASLSIKSNDTGSKSTFTVEGNMASELGFDKVAQIAVNAKGTLDDKAFESASNTLTLDNGKTSVELKGATTGVETFKVEKDASGMAKGVENFVKAYNSFMDFAEKNSSTGLDLLKKQMENAISKDRYNLQELGVTTDESGRLNLDKATLEKRISTNENDVKNTLTSLGGFAENLSRRASSALKAPVTQYMPPDSSTGSRNTASDMYNYLSTSQRVSLFNMQQRGSILDMTL